MKPQYTRPNVGDPVRVGGRLATVEAAWDGRGGPRTVLVASRHAHPERTVVHISRIP
jgi:hypothetical protein